VIATNVILKIVNDANLLPFYLAEDDVLFGEAELSDHWVGANSAVSIKGLGKNGFTGLFIVFYNRFDLSTLTPKLEVLTSPTTTTEDVIETLAEHLGAFADELTLDVTTFPVIPDGGSVDVDLVAVSGSVAYFGRTSITLTNDPVTTVRLMEDGSVRLMEDGTPRLMEDFGASL